tara:strand:+ start:3101 stop:3223 length:123 start_codon:yes stop_codon:yes gene_type:complete
MKTDTKKNKLFKSFKNNSLQNTREDLTRFALLNKNDLTLL